MPWISASQKCFFQFFFRFEVGFPRLPDNMLNHRIMSQLQLIFHLLTHEILRRIFIFSRKKALLEQRRVQYRLTGTQLFNAFSLFDAREFIIQLFNQLNHSLSIILNLQSFHFVQVVGVLDEHLLENRPYIKNWFFWRPLPMYFCYWISYLITASCVHQFHIDLFLLIFRLIEIFSIKVVVCFFSIGLLPLFCFLFCCWLVF